MTRAAGRRPDVNAVDFDPRVRILGWSCFVEADDQLGVVTLRSEQSIQHERGEETTRLPWRQPQHADDSSSEPFRRHVVIRAAGACFQAAYRERERMASHFPVYAQEADEDANGQR